MIQNAMLILIVAVFLASCDNLRSRPAAIKSVQAESSMAVWSNVLHIKGSGDQRSATFRMNTSPLKVTCTYKNQSPDGDFVLYLVEDGKSIATDGGLPVLIGHGESEQEITKNMKPGNYYFHIVANIIFWELQVFEKVSR